MKIFCILHNDPKSCMLVSYSQKALPNRKEYTNGMNLVSPKKIDFTPGRLVGYISRVLGLTKSLEDSGHNLKVTSNKDREGSQAEKGLIDDALIIHQPFLSHYQSVKAWNRPLTLKGWLFKTLDQVR